MPRKNPSPDVNKDAEERFTLIMGTIAAGVEAGRGFPALIPLSDYASAADFKAVLGPGSGWEWEYWRRVNTAVRKLLEREGLSVVMVPISPLALQDWLLRCGLTNSPANRAQFVAVHLPGIKGVPPIPDRDPQAN